ncbi:MAG: glycosyltransferase family 4 protein [Bacteroidota bacterium]|nr:glycosyltransferase family 4 protein [Bacteroidota bacterium]
MRVLLLSNKFPFPENDGSSIAIGSSIRALLSAGAKVELLSLNTKKHYKDPRSLPPEILGDFKISAIEANTDITPFGALANLLSGKPYHISRFDNSNFREVLDKRLMEDPPDIVMMEGLFMAPYLEQVRQRCPDSKVVLRAHNIEHRIWERQLALESSGLKKSYLGIQVKRLRKYEEHICSRFDAILPITIHDLHFFEKVAPKADLHVFPSGFDPGKYPFLGVSNNHAFSLASMDWIPNIAGMKWFLEEVWPLVINALPQAKMLFAGRNMPMDYLQMKITGVEIQGEIDDAIEMYAQYGIQVVPLLSGSGMRVKIMEGLAYGKVIISTVVGAEGIDAAEEDGLFRAENPHTFAKKLIRLMSGDHDLQELGKRARERALKVYSNPVIGEKLMNFFRHILDGHSI